MVRSVFSAYAIHPGRGKGCSPSRSRVNRLFPPCATLLYFVIMQHSLIVCIIALSASVLPFCAADLAAYGAETPEISRPLRVLAGNPRYFTVDGKRAVYLTGSHNWNVLQDYSEKSYPPEPLDYDAFLRLLADNHHNFFRMWTWEQQRWDCWSASDAHWRAPSAFARDGSQENAMDGLPKYDLTRFNDAYFARLRQRVAQAQAKGIYVAVMLFQGVSVEFKRPRYKLPWNSHPFHAGNNINSIDADTNHDGQGYDFHEWPLASGVWELQQAYIRKMVDTVNEFDNVLYEVANECHPASTAWQYEVIRCIQHYEASQKPKQHPVGMTAQFPNGSTTDLYSSPADWISPSGADWDFNDPPAATGRKVVLADTDHLPAFRGDPAFVWKAFLRGNQPLYMDDLARDEAHDKVRRAMGSARRYAERFDLAAMTPRPELCSTRYCLANPGKQYLVYAPQGAEVKIDLSAEQGKFAVEWFDTLVGTTQAGDTIDGGAERTLQSPSAADAVMYLRRLP